MPPARALSVLVVDDNSDAADTLAGLVELYGHRAYVASNAAEAVLLAHACTPDVVFLDVGLPDADGYAVVEKFRQDLVTPPLAVVVTGFGDMAGRSKAAGIDHHFTKPVEPRVIEDLLRQHALKLEREESPLAARARRAAVTPPE